MGRKLTYNEVKTYIESYGYKLISKEYVNSNKKLNIKCPSKHEYKASYGKFQSGRRCPHCSNRVKITKEDVETHLHQEGYALISAFQNSNVPMIVRCPNGHEWKVAYQKYKNGRRYSKCSGEQRKHGGHVNWDLTLVKEKAQKYGYEVTSAEYVNNHAKLKMTCEVGHPVEITWNHFTRGVRCRICSAIASGEKQRTSTKEVDEMLARAGYKRIGSYMKNHKSLEVECDNGHHTTITMGNFSRGVRCKYCQATSGEKEIMKTLENMRLKYEKEYTFTNSETGTYMYFDFAIFEEDSEKVDFIIEFDGQHHFYENTLFDTPLKEYQERDRRKNSYCSIHEIPLLRIPYTEKGRVHDIIDSYISNGTIEEYEMYSYLNKP